MAILSFPGNDQSSRSQLQVMRFKNNAGTTAPAFGILRVTGLVNTGPEEGLYLTVDQSNSWGAQDQHAINLDMDVSAGNYGYCTLGQMNAAYYDTGDGTPAIGEAWGPRSGGWKLRKYAGGFRIVGILSATYGRVLVTPLPMLTVRGWPTADVAAGASGTLTVYAGAFGSEASQTDTISNVRNDSSCTIKQNMIATANFVYDNQGWNFETGKTS